MGAKVTNFRHPDTFTYYSDDGDPIFVVYEDGDAEIEGQVWVLGAMRATVTSPNGTSRKVFVGETCHHDALRWATDIVMESAYTKPRTKLPTGN